MEDDEDTESQALLPPPAPPPPPFLPPASSSDAGTTNTRWLRLLCAETFLLLVLQLWLGEESGSLSLIADLPHSVTDVVTYVLAYWAEHAKLRLAETQDAAGKAVPGKRCLGKIWTSQQLDAASASLGLFILLSATVLVAREAINRLMAAPGLGSKGDTETIGSALLTFSVVSTAGNVAVLIMFRRWQQADLPPFPESRPSAEMVDLAAFGGDEASSGRVRRQNGRSSPPRRARQGKTRLCDMRPPDCQDANCKDADCSEHGPVFNKMLAALPTLHDLVHPGCQGHAGSTSKNGTKNPDEHSHSLNTSSAMLHLLSDVLRGFLMFGVAVLMKCHLVSNATRADAICALVVAALVVLGSGALFLEVARSLCNFKGRDVDDL